ncbi:hypothetical protein MMC17_006483 [Xylographa soralifera]|nr:hypothetical protein [Xylographa soralifera]
MPPNLLSLPLEMLHSVTRYLELEDFCNLVQARAALGIALGSGRTSKEIATRCIPQSREVHLARRGLISYKEALFRTFNRRKAYRTAQPFSVLVLGEGSDFLYRDGVLAYLNRSTVHIIDVHECSDTELVLDLRQVLGLDSEGQYIFRLMHYQDHVLSVLWNSQTNDSLDHLVVFETTLIAASEDRRLLLHTQIPTGQKQFVRHDSKHLISGTYTGTEDSEDDTWKLSYYNLVKGRTSRQQFPPESFSSADIGSNIVFEIFDEYFYAITSQITVDAESPDPSSYYGGCRYCLSGGSLQDADYWRIWRRQQREGPIHDLWTDFSMRRDENSRDLVLNETRREWQDGFSKQKRTFYTEPVNLTTICEFDSAYKEHLDLKKAAVPLQSADDDEEDCTVESSLAAVPDLMIPELSSPHKRSARHFQPEYYDLSPAEIREFSLANTKYRNYNYSTSAFLEIVVDRQKLNNCPDLSKYICLRIGSRISNSFELPHGSLNDTSTTTENVLVQHDQMYCDGGIRLWPPVDAPAKLHKLLNCTPIISKLHALSDERSVIYMAPSSDRKRNAPIILINFDPKIQFQGLPRLDPEGDEMDVTSIEYCLDEGAPVLSGLSTNTSAHSGREMAPAFMGEGTDTSGSWARIQRAEWLENKYGFELQP